MVELATLGARLMGTLPPAAPGPDAASEPSIGDLVRRLVEDTGHLVQTEFQLARSEVGDNVKAAAVGAGAIALGATFLLASLFTLLSAAIASLTPLVGATWAALIVAGGTATCGIVLVLIGKARIGANDFTPKRALASLRDDAEDIADEFRGDEPEKGPRA